MHGTQVLIVRDDGEGVIPELSREEALHYVATHIGHSRKMGLTPEQRAQRVIAGQYGVGLLGFWSIGRRLELRSRVAGSDLVALRLVEDDPKASISKVAMRLDAAATFTEVIVSELHSTAERSLGGRRLSEYLSAELRGQLLSRDVEVTVHDGVARGLAQKDFKVIPRRFFGERLSLPEQLEIPDHGAMRLELYLARGAERPSIQVACSGTLVADDIGALEALGLNEPPWIGRSLCGIIDFPGFKVPPGSRRGVLPDSAAAAFAKAMDELAAAVEAELSRLEQEQARAATRDVARELRRALRGFHRRLPQYELPAIEGRGGTDGVGPLSPGAAASAGAEPSIAPELEAPDELFAPGPLHSVRIEPAAIELAPGRERRVLAVALDREGTRFKKGVEFFWSVGGDGLSIHGSGSRPAVTAAPDALVGSGGRLFVTAEAGDVRVREEATITIVKPDLNEDAQQLGIPEPKLVSDPSASWRSRWIDGTWEVNEAHEDYVALRSEARSRLRYLLALLTKELVNRSYGQPGSDALLERMVEILAHAERNLRGG